MQKETHLSLIKAPVSREHLHVFSNSCYYSTESLFFFSNLYYRDATSCKITNPKQRSFEGLCNSNPICQVCMGRPFLPLTAKDAAVINFRLLMTQQRLQGAH